MHLAKNTSQIHQIDWKKQKYMISHKEIHEYLLVSSLYLWRLSVVGNTQNFNSSICTRQSTNTRHIQPHPTDCPRSAQIPVRPRKIPVSLCRLSGCLWEHENVLWCSPHPNLASVTRGSHLPNQTLFLSTKTFTPNTPHSHQGRQALGTLRTLSAAQPPIGTRALPPLCPSPPKGRDPPDLAGRALRENPAEPLRERGRARQRGGTGGGRAGQARGGAHRLMVLSSVSGFVCWMYLFPNWFTPRGQPVCERLGGTTDMARSGNEWRERSVTSGRRERRPPLTPAQFSAPRAACWDPRRSAPPLLAHWPTASRPARARSDWPRWAKRGDRREL